MPSAIRYFFDVPVYRLSREKYHQQRDEFVEGILFPAGDPLSEKRRAMEAVDRGRYVVSRDRLERSYGGAWVFNEIIGYVRLYFFGSQIRGEYFGVTKKRILRSRTKLLEYHTHKLAPELDVPADASDKEIFDVVLKYVEDCKNELKGRYFDDEKLRILGPYVAWRKFYDQTLI